MITAVFGSFLMAETVFIVSGVLTVVTFGLWMSKAGKYVISPSSTELIENFNQVRVGCDGQGAARRSTEPAAPLRAPCRAKPTAETLFISCHVHLCGLTDAFTDYHSYLLNLNLNLNPGGCL